MLVGTNRVWRIYKNDLRLHTSRLGRLYFKDTRSCMLNMFYINKVPILILQNNDETVKNCGVSKRF